MLELLLIASKFHRQKCFKYDILYIQFKSIQWVQTVKRGLNAMKCIRNRIKRKYLHIQSRATLSSCFTEIEQWRRQFFVFLWFFFWIYFFVQINIEIICTIGISDVKFYHLPQSTFFFQFIWFLFSVSGIQWNSIVSLV